MIIKQLSINNGPVNLTNISLSFDSNGIYLIDGENGVGKTTILSNIVFGDYDVDFEDPDYLIAYTEKRYTLFSYVSQLIPDVTMKVSNIFQNCEDSYAKEVYNNYISVANIMPNRKFNSLSGGEKAFLSVLASLQKGTPYVWLDEPTNSMDDKTVDLFLSMIKRYSEDRKIIIISHDPRVKTAAVSTITVKREGIEQRFHKTYIAKSSSIKPPISLPSPFQSVLKITLNRMGILSFLILIITMILIIIIVDSGMQKRFSLEDLPPRNQILISSFDEVYGDLNKVYTENTNISIDRSTIANRIRYKDIPEIINENAISTIFIKSTRYFDSQNKSQLDTKKNKFPIFSIPNDLMQYKDTIIDIDSLSLDSGRLPYDNQREVSISLNILIDNLGFDSNIDEISAIGKKVQIDDFTYTVVGINYYDICYLSYSHGINKGFYEYKDDSYSSFMNNEISYLKNAEYYNPDCIDSALILTHKSSEKKVLNKLIKKYPANNYNSYTFDYTFKKHINKSAIKYSFIVAISISVLFSLILLFIFRYKSSIDLIKLSYFEIYYSEKKKLRRYYISSFALELLIVGFLSISFNFFYSRYAFADNWIIVLGYMIISIPTFIFATIRNKK